MADISPKDEPREGHECLPARAVPDYLDPRTYCGWCDPSMYLIKVRKISSIEALFRYRKEETQRDQELALRRAIQTCEAVLADLRQCAEAEQAQPRQQCKREKLHERIDKNLNLLRARHETSKKIWSEGWALRRMTEADLASLESMCAGLALKEALELADRFLLGNISLQELRSQIVKDHPERF